MLAETQGIRAEADSKGVRKGIQNLTLGWAEFIVWVHLLEILDLTRQHTQLEMV